MEMKSPPPSSNRITVRRNPPRKARPTPSTNAPNHISSFSSSNSNSIPQDIPSFPIDEILSIEVPQNPNPDLPTVQSPSSTKPPPLSENLKVFLRIRPLVPHQISGKLAKNGVQNSRSKNAWPKNPTTLKNTSKPKVKKKNEICVTVNNDSHSVTLCPPPSSNDVKRVKSEVYEGFSYVFSAESSQNEVYEKMVNPLVEDFLLRGKSAMLAALGPSGTGKTHTVFGSPREPGMVPLALRRIFSTTEGTGTQSPRKFHLSMFEICSEKGKSERMFDLSSDGGDLVMQQSNIKGLQEAIIHDVQQAESLIACGMLKRATAMTNSNNQSSRSQCIINIRSGPNKIDGGDDQSNGAVLTIVDLAGAEREKRTGNLGARLLESNFINNTSMVFGLCLRSLLEHQKNPKKPLQKHFQSSLLTRYLRDYLEGKKRMALILTVKSGEEDYLDTSLLLRQASPYMKIKFNKVEEPFNSNCNKRHIQTIPGAEQLKRVKLSSLEACLLDEEKCDGAYQYHKEVAPEDKEAKSKKVLLQSPNLISLEVNNGTSVEENPIESSKSDRKNQIMQNFAKALWNVLKQYNEKLEVAENEIQNLRECQAKEKGRCSELEKELKDLKSSCSCWNEASAEVSPVDVDESRANLCSELEGSQYPDIQEVTAEVSSLKRQGPEHINNESCSTMVSSSGLVIASCVGVENFEEQCYQTCDIDNADDSKNLDVAREYTCSNGQGTGFNLKEENINNEEIPDAMVSNSGMVIASCVVENFEGRCDQSVDQTCDIGIADDLKNLDVEREYTCSNGQGTGLNLKTSESINNEDIPDAMVSSSGMVSASCVENFEGRCDQTLEYSAETVDNVEDLEEIKDKGRENVHSNIKAKGPSESVISPSQSLIITTGDSHSSVEVKQSRNEHQKEWLDPPVLSKEDVACVHGCDASDAPEVVLKLASRCKPVIAEKPKRRLLPASSILLKDISGLDLEDVTEKPKGTRGEKKVAADEIKRTQGSISLLHLLKTNLHL